MDELTDLPGLVARPQTFMEIGGYPHYENVCSNFLAFFLDPEGPHGLGSLFLDALAGSVGVTGADGSMGGSVSVEREVVTESGNRIDILLTSDSHAVLIENKIHAAVANPFGDYSGYLDGLKNENGEGYGKRIKVLLTLHPSKKGAGWGFVNVTHSVLVDAVRSSLGHHVSAADARYLTLMLDFLNTLENLGGGTRMNQGYVELLAARGDEVARFLEAVNEVRGELRAKVQRLASLIDVEGYRDVDVKQIPWRPNRYHSLEHFLQHRIHVDEESYVVVEPVISPRGWEVHVFRRVSSKSQNHPELQRVLGEEGIPPEADTDVLDRRFGYGEEDLDGIASFVEEELGRKAALVRRIRDEVSRSGS